MKLAKPSTRCCGRESAESDPLALRRTARHSKMNSRLLLVAFVSSSLLAVDLSTSVPALPDGAGTEWLVAGPEELVLYLAFDPATVRRRLPSHLRFLTIAELASGGLAWAKDFLGQHPTKEHWGVSFLEFGRARTFRIDGRTPAWPAQGAFALWFARVAPSDAAAELGPGRPLLALEFWLPDRAYVSYMSGKGYYASYGAGRLIPGAQGRWSGSLAVNGLAISAECTPVGPVTGGSGSAGMQTIFPPASSAATDVVRVAFAGHREQACETAPTWTFRGSHPLASAVALDAPTFQFGYSLRGGTYPHP